MRWLSAHPVVQYPDAVVDACLHEVPLAAGLTHTHTSAQASASATSGGGVGLGGP